MCACSLLHFGCRFGYLAKPKENLAGIRCQYHLDQSGCASKQIAVQLLLIFLQRRWIVVHRDFSGREIYLRLKSLTKLHFLLKLLKSLSRLINHHLSDMGILPSLDCLIFHLDAICLNLFAFLRFISILVLR
jgi:hypothetical protein